MAGAGCMSVKGPTSGMAPPAPAPKTGQTISQTSYDDNWHGTDVGVVWPNPRFTVQNDTNCVQDNLTRLVWTRNANIAGKTMPWENAVQYCQANLNATGYGGYRDWRLPNVRELQSLVDYGRADPALPEGHPCDGVVPGYYWSSTPYIAAGTLEFAWHVNLYNGYVYGAHKSYAFYVWPVRGGRD